MGGYFFDTNIRQEAIDEERLNPQDNLEEFGPVSDADLAHICAAVGQATASGCGNIATFGGTAFGDIALVPAPFLKCPRGIRDIAEWYVTIAMRKDYVHAIFSRQCDIALDNLEKIRAVVGNQVDAVFICGTDFGTQTSRFCSVETFDELWLPYYRRINNWIHRYTEWKTFGARTGAMVCWASTRVMAGWFSCQPFKHATP